MDLGVGHSRRQPHAKSLLQTGANIRFPKFGTSVVAGSLRAPGAIRGRDMRMVMGPQIAAPAVAAAAAAQPTVSTHTNDPSTANCRVFVGNLNTIQLTSDDVMEIFQKYGDVIAISVHKGYAFVQFTRTFEARIASESEDGMIYAGQRIDCNVASEPKPNAGRKRAAGPAQGFGANAKRNKSADVSTVPTNRNLVEVSTSFTAASNANRPDVATSGYSCEADILICGRCRSLFTSVDALVAHKQKQCKLLFVCQCEPVDPGIPFAALQTYHELTCSSCEAKLPSAWSLIKHLESAHDMTVCAEAAGWRHQEKKSAEVAAAAASRPVDSQPQSAAGTPEAPDEAAAVTAASQSAAVPEPEQEAEPAIAEAPTDSAELHYQQSLVAGNEGGQGETSAS